jgi:hypothetical protein
MAGAFQKELAPLSVAAFRDWALSRPDEERWELIDGVPMMMAPPTRDHQRIASNLERLLNDALERAAGGSIPRLAAYQRIGLNLGPAVQHYDPEPDVAVVELASGRDPPLRRSLLSGRGGGVGERSNDGPGQGRSLQAPPRLRLRPVHPPRPVRGICRFACGGRMGSSNAVSPGRSARIAGIRPGMCAGRPLQGNGRAGRSVAAIGLSGASFAKSLPAARSRPCLQAAMTSSRDIARLIEIMAALRTPGTGCPCERPPAEIIASTQKWHKWHTDANFLRRLQGCCSGVAPMRIRVYI